jgi:hypothetical protein
VVGILIFLLLRSAKCKIAKCKIAKCQIAKCKICQNFRTLSAFFLVEKIRRSEGEGKIISMRVGHYVYACSQRAVYALRFDQFSKELIV